MYTTILLTTLQLCSIYYSGVATRGGGDTIDASTIEQSIDWSILLCYLSFKIISACFIVQFELKQSIQENIYNLKAVDVQRDS